jgi:hypothetical protein
VNLDVSRRDALATAVLDLLRADYHVVDASIHGSVGAGTADLYSDIDIHAKVGGVSDRAFAETVPDAVRSIGRCLVEGWGFAALPDYFVRTFYFDDYPLFWHVDIWCESDVHVDGADLKATYHWPQVFKIWIDELSDVVRGAKALPQIDPIMARWDDVPALPTDTKERLAATLDVMRDRAVARGSPCGEMYARCDELRRDYLT